MFKRLTKTLLLSLALPLSAAAQAPAGAYPTKVVTMIVPYPAGSSTDLEGRLYANKLTERLGQPFVLDFKPGAGNRVATDAVLKAPPDGHTLMFTAATHTVVPLAFPDMGYDLYKVLAPVTLISKRYGLIVVNPSLPIRNMTEWVAYAKANPGKINIGVAGAGGIQHLSGLWLNSVNGIDTTIVPYKAANAIILDLVAGRLQTYIGTRQAAMPLVKTGKLRAIAQTTLVRHPDMPDLPTASETVPGFEYPSWLGLLAPEKTPLSVRSRLASEINRIVKLDDVVKKVGDDAQLVGSTPQEFEQVYLREHEQWKKLVKETGLKLE